MTLTQQFHYSDLYLIHSALEQESSSQSSFLISDTFFYDSLTGHFWSATRRAGCFRGATSHPPTDQTAQQAHRGKL